MQVEPAGPSSHQGSLDDQLHEEEDGQPAGLGLAEFPDVGRVEEVASVLRCSRFLRATSFIAMPRESLCEVPMAPMSTLLHRYRKVFRWNK